MPTAGRSSRPSADGVKPKEPSDFLKFVSIDLSSFEARFDEIIARIESVELRLDHPSTFAGAVTALRDDPSKRGAARRIPLETLDTPTAADDAVGTSEIATPSDTDGESALAAAHAIADPATLAEEIAALRAAQLRLKIDHEVTNAALKVDLETMRREIELRPDKTEMREFRAEMDVELTKTLRGAQDECARIEHVLSLQLSESVLGENQWKSQFEESMGARIQDVWSGVHAASNKLQENMQMLQTDMIKQEEITREVSDAVHQMRAKTLALEQDSREHASALQENSKGLDHVHSQCVSLERTLSLHESDVANRFSALVARVDATDTRVSACQGTHEAFASDTDKTLASLASDLAAVQSSLGTHHGSLQMLDAGLTRQGAEAMRMGERMDKTDMRVGGIDGRLVSAEKKLATAGNVIQEHYQEMLHLVGDVKVVVDQAAHDRAGIKRVAADISYSLQETQQTLLEVSKVASTTEIALARTAAEIPKIGALVATNSANIAKNRQTIRDLTAMADDEKSFTQALQSRFDKEVVSTNARFTEVASRAETTDQAIVDAGNTTMNVKHTLEEAIRYNGNLIHQLNTMVDSIAITESAEGMEDKMAKFALGCAELGLKLEHFSKNVPTSSPLSLSSSSSSSTSSSTLDASKTDTKAELALLLTKVIRFLGSGVSIDQNKYLLAAKRTHYIDPSSGAVIIELPPQQVLEGFRTAKATAFVAKTRLFMDQMHPVVPTNKYAIEFRDALARKLQFVLEFGLANLFPNTGRPLSAANKRGGEFGTCIACDRPIDSPEEQMRCESRSSMLIADPGSAAVRAELVNATQHHQQDPPMSPENSSFANDAVAEEHRLRRQRIMAGGSAFVSNRIDTKSVIPGRSGVARGVRPKSGHEPIHQAPGKADYVYRGGFRIPKPAAASSPASAPNMPSVESVLLAGIVASTNPDDYQSANQQQPSLADSPLGSRLEKVALLGRCQSVDIPTAIPSADSKQSSTLVRPHTAPYRAKSLPKLIDAPSGGIGGAGAPAGSLSTGGIASTASLPGAYADIKEAQR